MTALDAFLVDVAAAACRSRRFYFTGLRTNHAVQVEAAAAALRYSSDGVAVVHDHEHVTVDCVPACRLVVASAPLPIDPHR